MISAAAFFGIVVVALGMVLTPGPNMIYLVSRTLAQGRSAGMLSLVGVAVGFLGYLLASAAGLAALFAVVPFLYDAVKLAGAGYLLWLAWQAVRGGRGSLFVTSALPPDSHRRLFSMGLVTALLNPKIAVLYASLLPQFVDPAAGNVGRQVLQLGLAQIAVSLTVNALIVLSAGRIAALLSQRPVWLRVQRWFMATALTAIALRLVTDRTRPSMLG
jgi:threonine/homoserine/homoserine lactone efflux protein